MLTLDLNSAVQGLATRGLTREDISSVGETANRCIDDLAASGPWKGWVDLPLDPALAARAAGFARTVDATIGNVAVLGIGGSSLGAQAVHQATRHPLTGLAGGRTHLFLDNSDPDTVGTLLDELDPARTLYVVITKSGSTAETATQLLAAWERAEKALGAGARDHFVFITDPERGDLRTLAARLGVRTFPVPPDVGGRFSVLSAVGLVPAALMGVDPAELVAGARSVREACLERAHGSNPAALLASVAYLMDTRLGRNVHVVMTYSDRLAAVGSWFRQIWAESLGKGRSSGPPAGPTPLDARGATDQHSLLQLLVEGPPDKFVIFIDVRSRRRLRVPAIFGDLESFGYLGGRDLGELIDAERRSTEMSLARAGTPSVTLSVDEVSPASLGALFYVFEVATAIAGSLYGVDPYDQPGVEEGKKLAAGMLGRQGYEQMGEQAREFAASRSDDLVIRS